MVPQLEIYVDGKGSSFRTAERGYVRLNFSSTSTDQAQASHDVQSAVAKLTSAFRALAIKTEDGRPHPDAAVTAFTVSALSTVSAFQRDDQYRQVLDLPKEHTVKASAEIIFRNMAKLAEMSNELATMPHVSMSETEWRITEPTRVELEREARVKAITDAVQKAEDYASVVGRQVIAVEIKDQPTASGGPYLSRMPQMQQQQIHPQQQQQMNPQQLQQMQMMLMQQQQAKNRAAMRSSTDQDSQALTLEPKSITVSAHVNAKFVSADGNRGGMELE
ncbi:hypothetical protein N0V88_006787 [Collariella sp. IMI 366227]|nr:hypothetical protein N0V88_006787 [Collariella sp. IMI 366227]